MTKNQIIQNAVLGSCSFLLALVPVAGLSGPAHASGENRLESVNFSEAPEENAVIVVFPGLTLSDGLEGLKFAKQKGCRILIHNEQLLLRKITDDGLAENILPTNTLAEAVSAILG